MGKHSTLKVNSTHFTHQASNLQEAITLQIVFIIPSFPPFPSFLSLPLQGTLRMIHVSVDQGETWNMAQLPPVGHEQFYSILAANDEMVFMHVDEPGGQSTRKHPLITLNVIKQSSDNK